MDRRIEKMLSNYSCHSRKDFENALKEIIQELALLALWRAKFFEHAAFYGGTALRILYGLDRFSEDIDFSLLKPKKDFTLDSYNDAIETELQSYGLIFSVENRNKAVDNDIRSAFIKAGTKQQLINIQVPSNITDSIHNQQMIKIKMEVDVDPPGKFQTETRTLLQPIPFSVNTYTLPNLFAGKIHALLCRKWDKRIKGRDWYDFVWYVGRKVPVNLEHLKERLVQSGTWESAKTFTAEELASMLNTKISKLDFELAKQDVIPFIEDPNSLDLWSKTFFNDITSRLETV